MGKITIITVAIIIMLINAIYVMPKWSFQLSSHETQLEIKDFRVKNLKGEIFDLDQYKNKILIIDFWNTHCGSCIRQFPKYEALYQNLKNRRDVELLILNEGAVDSFEAVKQNPWTKDYTFPVYYDESKIMKQLSLKGVPQMLIVKNGIVKMIFDYPVIDMTTNAFVRHINSLIEKYAH